MALNCGSSNGKSNVLCNNPANTTSPQISNPPSNPSTSTTISNKGTDYDRCVHGCKDLMNRVMRTEPHRIQYRGLKYSRRSKFAKAINENFSEILLDGVPNTHLAICKCKRLIARRRGFERNLTTHLETQFHSNACPPSLHETNVEARIDEHDEEIGKAESVPTPTPPVIPISSSNEQVTARVKREPTSTQSIHLSQEFLDRKYKLEALLRIEPRLFLFLPALSIPAALHSPPGVFREFAIAGFETDDLILCTYCQAVLNIYANDMWNVDTHLATQSHYENLWKARGFPVKNFDFNILKSYFD